MVWPAMLLLLGTSGCGTDETLAARVEELSGRSIASLYEEGIEYSATISRDAGGAWNAKVTLKGPSGEIERAVVAETCEGAERAVALVIALRIEDELRAKIETKIELTKTATITTATTTPRQPLRAPDEPLIPRTARTYLSLRAGAGVSLGIQPELGATIFGGIGVGRDQVGRVMLTAGHQFTQSKQYGPSDPIGAAFEVEQLELAACPSVNWATAALHWCATFTGALVRASGFGARDATRVTRALIAVGAGLEISHPISPAVGLYAGAGARFSLIRPRFSFLNRATLHQPSLLHGDLRAGMEIFF